MSEAPDPVAARFVTDLLPYMTVEEKLGQLDLCHDPDDPALEQGIAGGMIGGVSGTRRASRWQGLATEQSRLGIPLLLTAPPAARGHSPWAIAASWDDELLRAAGAAAADHAILSGGNACHAPRIWLGTTDCPEPADLATDEPCLAVWLAHAFREGAASPQRGPRAAVLAIARCDGGSDEAQRSFASGLAAKSGSGAIDSSALDYAAEGGGTGGFRGILIGECARIRSIVAGQFATTRALSTGEAVQSALDAGLLAPGAIDAAVKGVLTAKYELALFRDPHRVLGAGGPRGGTMPAAELRRRTMVLLRNEAGLLPLSPVSDRVLLVGSGEAAQACSQALGRAGVGYSATPGLWAGHASGGAPKQHAEDRVWVALTREAAKRADFVLVVLDDSHFVEATRGAWPSPGPAMMQLLDALKPIGTRLVAMLATSGPVDLGDADPYFSAVLQCWSPGEGFEEALADILSGRAGPQGRMPTTVGQFAFGYGLGYGDGVLSRIGLTPEADCIRCSVTVRNAGSFPGRETVQIYVRDRTGDLRLVAFEHVMLAAGEEREISIALGLQALGRADERGTLIIEPGVHEILVGKDARRTFERTIDISPALARAIVNRDRPYLRLAS